MSKKKTESTIRENRSSNIGSVAYRVKNNREHQQSLILADKKLYLGGNGSIVFTAMA